MITMNNFGTNGRLGNQLFQYASMLGLANKTKHELNLPKWKYTEYFENVTECNDNINNHGIGSIFKINEKSFNYLANYEYDITVKHIKNDVLDFNGYFQSEKYWEHCKDLVKYKLKFKEGFIETVKLMNPNVNFSNDLIAIHVRRGDYVNNSIYHNLSMLYYVEALDKANMFYDLDYKQSQVIIFSDDIEYCKHHFSFLNNVYFSNGSEIEDLALMSLCNIHIISNSSFAWWGAYLSGSDDVIFPNILFNPNGGYSNHKIDDFYLQDWSKTNYDTKIVIDSTTFMIPYTYDSEDRLENLRLCINYLNHHFTGHNILVYEWIKKGKQATAIQEHFLNTEVLVDNTSKTFHRTRFLNIMAKISTTKVIINQDCDVLIPIKQLENAINKAYRDYDVVLPFDGRFAGIPRIPFYYKLLNSLDLGVVKTNYVLKGADKSNTYGGCVVYNKKRFLELGGENENFVSWGPEDYERIIRFKKLGGFTYREKGMLYHIEHVIGTDSGKSNPNFENNNNEYKKICLMNKKELQEYVKNNFKQ